MKIEIHNDDVWLINGLGNAVRRLTQKEACDILVKATVQPPSEAKTEGGAKP